VVTKRALSYSEHIATAGCGDSQELNMLHYAVVFFLIALVAAFFGFGGIASGAAGAAKILFVVFVVMAVVSFVFSLIRGV
jgi:uncharacterized membrane protein YtjA (UPF0391 family)